MPLEGHNGCGAEAGIVETGPTSGGEHPSCPRFLRILFSALSLPAPQPLMTPRGNPYARDDPKPPPAIASSTLKPLELITKGLRDEGAQTQWSQAFTLPEQTRTPPKPYEC
eukprot:859352-Amphidinium_carterae.2